MDWLRVSAAPVVCPLQGPYSLAYGKVCRISIICQYQSSAQVLEQSGIWKSIICQVIWCLPMRFNTKGGADRQCSHPPSLMDTCNDDSVIQIKYQVRKGKLHVSGAKYQKSTWKPRYLGIRLILSGKNMQRTRKSCLYCLTFTLPGLSWCWG